MDISVGPLAGLPVGRFYLVRETGHNGLLANPKLTKPRELFSKYICIETFEKRSVLFKIKEGDPPPNFSGLITGIH